MEQFSRLNTLDFSSDFVNVLCFSHDGIYLAVGTDDGILFIYNHRKQRLTYSFPGSSPVTAILWLPSERYALFVGVGRGECFLYRFSVGLFRVRTIQKVSALMLKPRE